MAASAPILTSIISSVIGPVLVLALGFLLSRRVKAIQQEVTNTHDENLRDDIDLKQEQTMAAIGEVRRDVGGLRHEIRQERDERFGLETIVHKHINREKPE